MGPLLLRLLRILAPSDLAFCNVGLFLCANSHAIPYVSIMLTLN
jgi:hypothetical protein